LTIFTLQLHLDMRLAGSIELGPHYIEARYSWGWVGSLTPTSLATMAH